MGSPLLGFFAIIVLAIVAVLVAAGIALAFLAAAIIAVLAGIGLISLSTLVGLSTRSASKAFQTFFLAVSSIAGTLAGTFLAIIITAVFNPAANGFLIAVSGAAVGLVAGAGAGLLFNLCWTRLLAMITRRKSRSAFPVVPPNKSLAAIAPDPPATR